jgi:peptidoglycan/xylan/chitin deacetylase (PgdA/CDA1 family)
VHRSLLKHGVNALDASGLTKLLQPFYGGRGAILALHRVLPDEVSTFIPGNAVRVRQLREILSFLVRYNWDLVSLNEIPDRLRSSRKTRRFMAITLDDGYRDNFAHGWPLFREFNAPFTVFPVTGFLNRTQCPWYSMLEALLYRLGDSKTLELLHPRKGSRNFACGNDEQIKALFGGIEYAGWEQGELQASLIDSCGALGMSVGSIAEKEFFSWDELKKFATDPLASVGVHTLTHARLASLSVEDAKREMGEARSELSARLGVAVDHIAYPYGGSDSCGPREFQIAEELGFRTGVTTSRGNLHARYRNTLFSLPRHTMSMVAHSASVRYLRISLNGIWDTPIGNIQG